MGGSGLLESGCHELSEIYGLYGLKHHIVEISGDVTKAGQQQGMIVLLIF